MASVWACGILPRREGRYQSNQDSILRGGRHDCSRATQTCGIVDSENDSSEVCPDSGSEAALVVAGAVPAARAFAPNAGFVADDAVQLAAFWSRRSSVAPSSDDPALVSAVAFRAPDFAW